MTTSQAPNFLTAIHPDRNAEGDVFVAGDCGVILKPDGGYRIISAGIDTDALRQDPETMDEATKATYRMGQKLMGIAIALANDQVMDILLGLAADPTILDPELLKQIANPN